MRSLALCLALSLFSAAPASAQVTDAERAAARQLFSSGDQHQQKGEYAEALEDFQKAQRIFSAPTNLLRIAQCQAALGRLVEASETYRQIIRAPLPAGSPPAFGLAVDQAKQELPQVEPRVPKLKIEVQPKDAPNLAVSIDGTPVNAALVGELLPWNPGAHKVTVFAPGYASSEQSVQLKERETKVVSFNLVATGGVVYTNPNDPNPVRPTDPNNPAGPGTPPPNPPPEPEKPKPVPARKVSQTSFLVGPHLGLAYQGGDLGESNFILGSSTSSDKAGIGGAIGIDLGIRFARNFAILGTLSRAGYSQGENAKRLANTTRSGFNVVTSAGSTTIGILGAYISNPDRTSFYGEIGVAQRTFEFEEKYEAVGGSTGKFGLEYSLKSTDFLIGGGAWIHAGNSIRLLPKLTMGFGSYGKLDRTCVNASDCGDFPDTKGHDLSTSKMHYSVFFGMAGYFNADL